MADLEARTADITPACTKLSAQAQGLVAQQPAPSGYVESLLSQGLATDGLEFIAHWLPKREAVWWGCLCLWHVSRPGLPAAEEAALRALVHWVREPTEPRRRLLEGAAEAAGHVRTGAGGLAFAAFFSGGSLAPPGLPVVAPPRDLTADTIARVLVVMALQTRPERAAETYRHFIELGLEVARGENRWN